MIKARIVTNTLEVTRRKEAKKAFDTIQLEDTAKAAVVAARERERIKFVVRPRRTVRRSK